MKPRTNVRPAARLRARLGLFLLLAVATARGEAWDPTNAAYDDLIFRATRYGNTEQRRAEKSQARDALFARGDEALRELMQRAHVENVMLLVLIDEMARYRVAPDKAAPVLAAFLDSEHAQTRRTAAYLLGFMPRGGQAARLRELMQDEKCRNAAIRTLGKWRDGRARAEIARLLREGGTERTRIVAANALRDIGDEDDLPVLIAALGDPAFLVRNGAARALAAYGWSAQAPLLKALPEQQGAARRQVIRLLGELEARRAVRPLQKLLKDPDPAVRADAEWALRRIAGGAGVREDRDRDLPSLESELLFR
jgi:HEAT repeat protein